MRFDNDYYARQMTTDAGISVLREQFENIERQVDALIVRSSSNGSVTDNELTDMFALLETIMQQHWHWSKACFFIGIEDIKKKLELVRMAEKHKRRLATDPTFATVIKQQIKTFEMLEETCGIAWNHDIKIAATMAGVYRSKSVDVLRNELQTWIREFGKTPRTTVSGIRQWLTSVREEPNFDAIRDDIDVLETRVHGFALHEQRFMRNAIPIAKM